jgi:hypothetical protein
VNDQGRLYSDKEVALILRKATDLQREAGSAAGEGLSLPMLADIADEIGVDREFVERAALALDSRTPAQSPIWGDPSVYQCQLSSQRKYSPDELLRLIDVVRDSTQHQGSVKDVLGSLEWKTIGQVNEIAVTATSQEQGTSIRVIGDRGAAATLTWGFSVAGGIVAAGVTGAFLSPDSLLVGIGILATGGTAGLGLGRALWARSTRKFQQRFMNLREEISRHLKEVDNQS